MRVMTERMTVVVRKWVRPMSHLLKVSQTMTSRSFLSFMARWRGEMQSQLARDSTHTWGWGGWRWRRWKRSAGWRRWWWRYLGLCYLVE